MPSAEGERAPGGLETARLRLRRFTPGDADILVALDADPAVMRHLSGGAPTARATIERQVLPRFLASAGLPDGLGAWAAHERAGGAFIGWFSLRPAPDEPGQVQLGYRLRREAWGRGYATEGARALVRLGFGQPGVRRVVATTYEENLASRRVLEKVGLRPVRRFRPTPEELAASGSYEVAGGELFTGEDVEYALERADWERSASLA